MDNTARIATIKKRLAVLSPSFIEVIDDSHKHIGHEGAKDGHGHFSLTLSSACLKDLSRIQQHQKIYEALGDLMQTDIHALSISVTN